MGRHSLSRGETSGEWNFCLTSEMSQHLFSYVHNHPFISSDGWKTVTTDTVSLNTHLDKKLLQNMTKTEEYYILGCDAMKSSGSSLTFRRNVLPPPSGAKSNSSKQLSRGKQHGLFFDLEDGSNAIL
jgi:hypothetical protein